MRARDPFSPLSGAFRCYSYLYHGCSTSTAGDWYGPNREDCMYDMADHGLTTNRLSIIRIVVAGANSSVTRSIKTSWASTCFLVSQFHLNDIVYSTHPPYSSYTRNICIQQYTLVCQRTRYRPCGLLNITNLTYIAMWLCDYVGQSVVICHQPSIRFGVRWFSQSS